MERLNDISKFINCFIVYLICDMDSMCVVVFNYYYSFCGNLKDVGWCFERCNEFINIFY